MSPSRPINFGVFVPQGWRMDLVEIPDPVEKYETMTRVAQAADRIGELVVGVPYRNPALLAKMLTTLDVITHGRTIVGLGAAWHDEEFRAYGWPFPWCASAWRCSRRPSRLSIA